MRKLLASWVAILLVAGGAEARLGRAGAVFLGQAGGARPLSLGGAYTAFAEGVDAVYFNPAGLANLRRIGVAFTHAELFAGMRGENFGAVLPVANGAIGFSMIGRLSGKIERTTPDEQMGTGEYYMANDLALGLSYARMMTDKFYAGFTVKLISQHIAEVSTQGVAVDLGATYNTGLRNLRFGFVIQHFGPDLMYAGPPLRDTVAIDTLQREDVPVDRLSEPYPLPMTFQGGMSMDLLRGEGWRFTVTADWLHPADQPATYAVGGEYSLNETIFLRFGHSPKNDHALTAGGGVRFVLGDRATTVDYSFQEHKYLSPIHRVSVGISL